MSDTTDTSDKTACMIVIAPDGGITNTPRRPDDPPSLEEMQSAVDGYVQRIPGAPFKGSPLYQERVLVEAFANEDGISRGLPPNHTATARLGWPYPLLGTVLVLEGFDPD